MLTASPDVSAVDDSAKRVRRDSLPLSRGRQASAAAALAHRAIVTRMARTSHRIAARLTERLDEKM